MSLPDATRAALGWTLLTDAIKGVLAEARESLLDQMTVNGSKVQEYGEDDQVWGTATRVGGGQEAYVADHAALLRWTLVERPDMVQQVLNPVWVDLVKAMALEHGQASDPETGQTIPGVAVRNKPYGLRITATKEAKAAARVLAENIVGNLLVRLPTAVRKQVDDG